MAKSHWEPPRGIRYKYQAGRPKPYVLIWSKDGIEKSRAYGAESERELAAKALVQKQGLIGDRVLTFDAEEWAVYLEFKKMVDGTDPLQVAREWKAARQGRPTTAGSKVREAVQKYFGLRKKEANWSADTERHAVRHLERFVRRFGDTHMAEVSSDDVRGWMDVLKEDDGTPLGAHAKKDHLKNVRVFFSYALREKWGAVANPCEHIAAPKTDDGDPIVISVKDAFQFFKTNRDERVIGRLALEAFGGLRYSTAGKIQLEAINQESRGIRMSGSIHKTGRTRYRQGQPENLWAWIKHAPASCWELNLRTYSDVKKFAGIRAGLRPIENLSKSDEDRMKSLRNIWRHSFISYHLARYKLLAFTQYLAQHASSSMTEDYEGIAEEIDAARYFAITPETTLLSYDEFLKLPVQLIKPEEAAKVYKAI